MKSCPKVKRRCNERLNKLRSKLCVNDKIHEIFITTGSSRIKIL